MRKRWKNQNGFVAGVWGGCTNCVKHGTSRAHLFDLSSLRGLHKSSPPPPRARGSSALTKIKTGIHLLGRYFLISISRNFHFLRLLESEYVPNVSLAYLVPFARFRQGWVGEDSNSGCNLISARTWKFGQLELDLKVMGGVGEGPGELQIL